MSHHPLYGRPDHPLSSSISSEGFDLGLEVFSGALNFFAGIEFYQMGINSDDMKYADTLAMRALNFNFTLDFTTLYYLADR